MPRPKIQTNKLNTADAGDDIHKYYAAVNADITNAVNKSHFTDTQITTVLSVADVLSMYYQLEPKINYRKTKASIKIERKRAPSGRAEQIRKCEEQLSASGWVKSLTPQGIIYGIKKELI